MIVRTFGWILILAAVAAAVAQVTLWLFQNSQETVSLGSLWYAVHAPSLNLAQAVVQRYIAAWLWDPVIVAVLTAPAWLVLGLTGFAILVIRRRRRRSIFADDS